ncbi:hypothetical protein RHSIM_Rhsim02G0196700 [Rhododendron simsii]|uniref:Uncharacterized protein n=1 Tax=Rhododendron simsii TaxID=118357 RepID=A0A834H8G8_RHOSS|nr:hypothetical protein RHSIM_Rhsim02G0196700 [Rhododendron simsii]
MRRVVTPPSTIDVDANGVVHEQVRYSDMPKQTSQQACVTRNAPNVYRALNPLNDNRMQDPMVINRAQITEIIQDMYGPRLRSLAKRLGSTFEKQKQGEGDQMETDEESAKSQPSRFPNDYLCIRCGREVKYGEAIIAEKEQRCAFSKSGIRFNTMGGNDLQIYVGAKLIYEGIDPGLFNRIESEHCYGPDDGPFLFRGNPVVPARPGVPSCQDLEAVGAQKQIVPKHGGQDSNVAVSSKSTTQPKGKKELKQCLKKKMEEFQKLMEADDEDLLDEESVQEYLIKDATPSPQKSATFRESLAAIQFGSVPINYQCNMILVLPKHFKAKPDQPMELAGDVEDITQLTVKIVKEGEKSHSQLINIETDEKGTKVVVLRSPDDASIRH